MAKVPTVPARISGENKWRISPAKLNRTEGSLGMFDIAYINEYTPAIAHGVLWVYGREHYEESSLGIGNGILRGFLYLRILVCGWEAYW